MSIKRYEMLRVSESTTDMVEMTDGDYVTYADHAAEIARLRAELQNAAKAALDAVALSCEKEREADALRAEVEGLRNALEKIASIRLNDHASIDAAYGHACSIANEALFDHSDAAMGASA